MPGNRRRQRGRTARARAVVSEGLRRVAGRPCTLCGGRARLVGVWCPPPGLSGRLGAPPGKYRAVAYPICDDCRATPGALTRVEDQIVGSFGASLARPGAN
jgi:hypothetical protein